VTEEPSLVGDSEPLAHSLHRAGTLIHSLDLRYRVYQFRLAGCHLYRRCLRSGWESQAAIPRRRYLAGAPLAAQATARNFCADFVILVQGIFEQSPYGSENTSLHTGQ
jgi:hypothetical protein